jgi:hypothetical protein
MLPRPTPETIADAISTVLSRERVRAFFAHSRERRTRESNFQVLPAKRRWVPACARLRGDEREATEPAERWKRASGRPFSSIHRNDLVALVVDHDVVVRAERIMIFRRERPRIGLAFLGLAKTCAKLRIAFWDYLGSRLAVPGSPAIPYLPELVATQPRPP